jgi:hypothetical protein
MVQWPSKDVVLAAAILGNGKARGVRAHPEPMDTEGVSFGARFALAWWWLSLGKMPAALSTNGAR